MNIKSSLHRTTKLNQILSLSLFAILSSTASADIKEVIEKSYPFDHDGRISLSNVNGNVHITSCDCSKVELTATIIASDQQTRDRINIDVDASKSHLNIVTRYENNQRANRNSSSEVIYKLNVPNKVDLKAIKLVNGDLVIENVIGELEAELINGELRSNSLSGDTKVEMVNGDIILKFADLDNIERIKLESVNGDITVKFPSNSEFKVEAETVSGNISNEFDINVEVGRYVGSEMEGKVGNGKTYLSMENVNGSIKLKKN